MGVFYLEYQAVGKGFSNVNLEHRPKGHEGMNLVDSGREGKHFRQRG